jgi:hypothetical protein
MKRDKQKFVPVLQCGGKWAAGLPGGAIDPYTVNKLAHGRIVRLACCELRRDVSVA